MPNPSVIFLEPGNWRWPQTTELAIHVSLSCSPLIRDNLGHVSGSYVTGNNSSAGHKILTNAVYHILQGKGRPHARLYELLYDRETQNLCLIAYQVCFDDQMSSLLSLSGRKIELQQFPHSMHNMRLVEFTDPEVAPLRECRSGFRLGTFHHQSQLSKLLQRLFQS